MADRLARIYGTEEDKYADLLLHFVNHVLFRLNLAGTLRNHVAWRRTTGRRSFWRAAVCAWFRPRLPVFPQFGGCLQRFCLRSVITHG